MHRFENCKGDLKRGVIMNLLIRVLFGFSAVLFNLLITVIFIASHFGKMQIIRKVGIGVIMLGIPFSLVLYYTVTTGNDLNVRIALAVVLVYILIELILDFLLEYDFRSKFITHFPYVFLEYGAFIGLIYTAFSISEFLGWAVSITFWLAMAAMIFYLIGESKKNKKINSSDNSG
jgi:hypothetical protein